MEDAVSKVGQNRATLAGAVRAEIERLIVTGRLDVGERLNEAQLASSMDVSRGTVREAIRSLADSGLIDVIANRGAFVRKLTVTEVRNLYDLRGAIFGMACASVARRVGKGDAAALLMALQENLKAMRTAHAADDREAYYAINIDFHDMLMAGAQNAKAKSVYDALVREMHLFRRRGLSVSLNVAQSISEHEAIVAAIAAGDENAARQAALQHIVSGLGRYLATVDDLEHTRHGDDPVKPPALATT